MTSVVPRPKNPKNPRKTENDWSEIGPLAWDLLLQTRRVNRRLERMLDRVLSAKGTTFTCLEVLHQAEFRAISASSVAHGLGFTRQGARRALMRLQDLGLLQPFVAEGGHPCARLTPSGRELLWDGVRWLTDILDAIERVPFEHRLGLEEALDRLDVAVTSRRLTSWPLD